MASPPHSGASATVSGAFTDVAGPVPHVAWHAAGVRAIFTTREGGVSGGPHATLNLGLHCGDDPALVAHNRRRVADDAGVGAGTVRSVLQVHGTEVWVDDPSDPGAAYGAGACRWSDVPPSVEADALVSRRGTPLAVMVADCVPVVIAGAGDVAHAVVHAGWRSAAGGVLEATMRALGPAEADGATCAIGPALGACCFEVGEEVADRFDDRFVVRLPDAPRLHLDLTAFVASELHRLGAASVDLLDACTSCDGRWFSHRRDRGATGRQCVLAWRPDAAPPTAETA